MSSRPPARHPALVAVLLLLGLLCLLWLLRPDSGPAPSPRAQLEVGAIAPGEESSHGAPSSSTSPQRDERAERDLRRPLRGEVHVLDNGLTVFLVEDHTEPVVSARLVFRVGSVADPEGAEGTAHLLEHLMFGGTDRLGSLDWEAEAPYRDLLRDLSEELVSAPEDEREAIEDGMVEAEQAASRHAVPNAYLRLLSRIGVSSNARTTMEYTDYHATFPPNRLEHWLMVEAERFSSPVLRGFANERRVVAEEIRMRTGHAEGALQQEVRRLLFGDHPYARPIVGDEASIRQTSIASLEAFFDTWYVAPNAALILVGDIDRTEAIALVESHLGPLPGGEVPDLAIEPPDRPSRVQRLPGAASEEAFQMSWAIVDAEPGETLALWAGGTLLVHRLDQRIGLEGFDVDLTRFGRAVRLDLKGRCRSLRSACEDAVLEEIRRLHTDRLEAADVEAARREVERDRLEEVEDPAGQGAVLASAFARGQDLDGAWRAIAGVRAVSAEQIQAAVHHHLGATYVITEHEPGVKLGSAPVEKDRRVDLDLDDDRISAFTEEVLALPVPPLDPAWLERGRHYTTADGGRVIAAYNPKNALFTLEARWDRGWADDPLVCAALRQWRRFRTTAAQERWGETLWRRGLTLGTSCSADEAQIRISGFARDASAAWTFVMAQLRTRSGSALTPDDAKALRRAARLPALLEWMHHGARSRARSAFPTADDLLEADATALSRSLWALASRAPAVLYVGPDHAATVAGFTGGAPPSAMPARPDRREADATTIALTPRWGMSTLFLHRQGEPFRQEDAGLHALMDAWLGGRDGVVVERLRTGGGFAYRGHATYLPGDASGEPNGTYLSFRVRRRERVEALRTVLDALAEDRLSAERWAHVRQRAEETLWSESIPFRQRPSKLFSWGRRGHSGDAREAAWIQLQDLTREDFEDFLAAEAARPPIVVWPGRASRRVRARLEGLGVVVQLTEEELMRR